MAHKRSLERIWREEAESSGPWDEGWGSYYSPEEEDIEIANAKMADVAAAPYGRVVWKHEGSPERRLSRFHAARLALRADGELYPSDEVVEAVESADKLAIDERLQMLGEKTWDPGSRSHSRRGSDRVGRSSHREGRQMAESLWNGLGRSEVLKVSDVRLEDSYADYEAAFSEAVELERSYGDYEDEFADAREEELERSDYLRWWAAGVDVIFINGNGDAFYLGDLEEAI